MKKISVCKNQQIIFGHVVPTGAVYGKFTYNYTRRIVTGYSFVHDKNNRQIFNKNGTPKMRAIIKEVPTTNTLIYSVESFLDYTFKKGEKRRYLYAWVLFDNGKKWQEIAIGTTPVTQELEKMVREYIKEHALKEPKIASVKSKTVAGTPKRRQANQFDNVFRMRPDYSGTINEEVRPRMPIVHTNMDKLHPIDERPIVVVKSSKPYERPNEDSKSRTIAIHNYNSNDYVKPENRKPARVGYHYVENPMTWDNNKKDPSPYYNK